MRLLKNALALVIWVVFVVTAVLSMMAMLGTFIFSKLSECFTTTMHIMYNFVAEKLL